MQVWHHCLAIMNNDWATEIVLFHVIIEWSGITNQ
jgi:hypothetical protein